MGRHSLRVVALPALCGVLVGPLGAASAAEGPSERRLEQASAQRPEATVRLPVGRVPAAASRPPQITYSARGVNGGTAVVLLDPASRRSRTLVSTPSRGPYLTVDAWSRALSRVFYTRFTDTDNDIQTPSDLAVDSVPQAGGRSSREVTGGGGSDVSRDGRRIVYTRLEGRTGNLFIADRDGRNPRRLTGAGGGSPRFSPDGRRIVFSRYYPTRTLSEEQADLFTIGADGTGLRRVTRRADVSDDTASFSPDGRRLLFTRFINVPPEGLPPEGLPSDGLPYGVWSVGVDGRGLRLVRQGALAPDWATNGWLTYLVAAPGARVEDPQQVAVRTPGVPGRESVLTRESNSIDAVRFTR